MRWVVNLTDRFPYLVVKRSVFLLGRKLGETHIWRENCGEERSLLALSEIEARFLGRQSPRLVHIPPACSRLLENKHRRRIKQHAHSHTHTHVRTCVHICSYLLTHAAVPVNNLIVVQLFNQLATSYGTRWFINIFWKLRYCSVSWTRLIQSTLILFMSDQF